MCRRWSCWVLALFGWEGAGSAGTSSQTPGWRAPSDAQRVVETAPVWLRPSNIPRLVVEESDFFPSTTWLAAPRIST